MFDPMTIIGVLIFMAITGLLKPIRNLFTSLGGDVETVNEVKGRMVKEWDADSAINHAKKMNKTFEKASELGTIKTYDEVMELLRAKNSHKIED